MLEIVSYGAAPDGSDCTPALNAAIADALAGDQKQIHVPAGQWTFRTPPQPLSAGVGLVGEGKSTTILTRAYSGGEFLVTVAKLSPALVEPDVLAGSIVG